MRVHRHRRLVGLTALGAAALAAFVLAYFEPQKLFIDDRVAEALPAATAIRTLTVGTFRSYEHSTSGRARVIATADGRRYVRFEDFATSNGPALKVYLSAAPATGRATALTIASSTSATSRATSAARTTRSRPACA